MKLWLSAAFMAALPLSAWSVDDWRATPEEQEMCHVAISAKAKAIGVERKRPALDKNWATMNHYCDCLRFYNRALAARSRSNRDYLLDESLGGCNYVLDHTSADFAFRPELHYRNGQAYEMKGDHAKAETEYLQVLNSNPAGVPEVYQSLGDIYERRKQKAKALEFYTEGLRHSPESKALKRRYLELGGKEPFPEPHVKAATPKARPPGEAAAPAAQPEAVAPAAQPEAAAPAAQPEAAAPIARPEPPATAPREVAKPAAPAAQPPRQVIGSPTNPWCRFCPEAVPPQDPGTSKPQAVPKAAP